MHVPSRRNIGFRAGIAEFLLILRLKARRRADHDSDIPEHATRIILVTCKNWFTDYSESSGTRKKSDPASRRCVPL